ncbi:GMC family oxidoreductase [Roseateles koreensis]|uniref:GMC family oxidoreductase n=1 Tax=Roseateles koreensis TaxID=2987526 RepID=A0ABT5KQ08_9BURK|nr:GMC family oxidoreductase [Roseateles koreensis]MDC8784535.1 GMC family oxidoreductase [Roseateles koreensis]
MSKPSTHGNSGPAAEGAPAAGRRRDFLARLIALGTGTVGTGAFGSYAEAAEASQSAALKDSYDYIIVGAGSAGCLLADRLSATGASVLLIEAGTSNINQPKIAEVAYWLQNLSSETDWARLSTPQPHLANRRQGAPGGKVWGGSGSINAMIWLRGDPRDYAQWCRLVGQEWNPDALNRAYLKVAQPAALDAAARHAQTGRINVGRYADSHPLTAAYLASSAATGLRTIELNAGRPLDGVGVAEVNATADGRRSGPAQAMLVPALVRPNLKVLSDTLITKLLIQGRHCRGVEAVVDNVALRINATHETIVSAGACESPKILMLSGLGPADHLAAHGIRVQQAMPAVGSNLQDHMLTSVVFKSKVNLPAQVSNGVSTMAYYSTGYGQSAPDVQVAGMQYPFGASLPAGSGYAVIAFLSKPRSRGSVRLTSADPRQAPSIDPRYLEQGIDQDNMLLGLDRAIDIGSNQGMNGIYGGRYSTASLRSRAEKLAFIAQQGGAGLHFTGTCIAGRDASTSVVDANFKVWGIERLRVVDASVIPEVPTVNIQASVLTVAQLAAERLISEARAAGLLAQ